MKSFSKLLLIALAILLIDAGRDILRRDYYDAARTILVVLLSIVALRPRKPSSGA